LGIDFAPQDELEYANFLKLILGRHDESTSLSPALTQFAAQYRPSLANALEQVALVFMPLPAVHLQPFRENSWKDTPNSNSKEKFSKSWCLAHLLSSQ
jgi:hypothetical protein